MTAGLRVAAVDAPLSLDPLEGRRMALEWMSSTAGLVLRCSEAWEWGDCPLCGGPVDGAPGPALYLEDERVCLDCGMVRAPQLARLLIGAGA